MLIILEQLSLEEGEDLKEVLRVFASLLTMSSIFAQKWNSSNLICMTVLESGNVRPDPLVRIGGSFRCIPVRLCTFVNAGIKILSLLPFSNTALSNTMSLVIGFGMIPMLLTLMIKDWFCENVVGGDLRNHWSTWWTMASLKSLKKSRKSWKTFVYTYHRSVTRVMRHHGQPKWPEFRITTRCPY